MVIPAYWRCLDIGSATKGSSRCEVEPTEADKPICTENERASEVELPKPFGVQNTVSEYQTLYIMQFDFGFALL